MATCPQCRVRYPDDVQVCATDGERLLPDAACQAFDVDLKAGQKVGEYLVEKKIGEGGFGTVYAAEHPVIGKRAAIKVLNREFSSNPSVVSRFVSEARAVNQIQHRHIIDIFSFGVLDDGRQYFVMELLEGLPLDEYLKQQGMLCVEEAIPILRAVARALDAAHAANIVHRDLKPENVFLTFDEDGVCFPKLLDFGIAKLVDSSSSHKTRTGAAIGTPYYMSPEQCRGKGVDYRTDIYSFGVMTHELLTGTLPFDGASAMDLMFKHNTEPAPPMSQLQPALSTGLDSPVLHMLAKDPKSRPPNLSAAVESLAAAAMDAGHEIQAKISLGERSGLRSVPADMRVSSAGRSGQSHQTIEATVATGSLPEKKSKSWLLAGGAALLVAGVAAVALLGQGPSDASSAAGATDSAEVDSAGVDSAEVRASAAAHVAPDPQDEVSVEAAPSASVAAAASASAAAAAASASIVKNLRPRPRRPATAVPKPRPGPITKPTTKKPDVPTELVAPSFD